MQINCESVCQSVSQLRRDDQKMANHFSSLKSSPVYRYTCVYIHKYIHEYTHINIY